ncbi:MAG: hypothetical protein QNJ94_12670 [Alphaproteobacteria bacterium]|nr:hypothetical protein [Alphaproteobacteria bacterium]
MVNRPDDPEGPGGRSGRDREQFGLGRPRTTRPDPIQDTDTRPRDPALSGVPSPDPQASDMQAAFDRLAAGLKRMDEESKRRQRREEIHRIRMGFAKDRAAIKLVALTYLEDGLDPETAVKEARRVVLGDPPDEVPPNIPPGTTPEEFELVTRLVNESLDERARQLDEEKAARGRATQNRAARRARAAAERKAASARTLADAQAAVGSAKAGRDGRDALQDNRPQQQADNDRRQGTGTEGKAKLKSERTRNRDFSKIKPPVFTSDIETGQFTLIDPNTGRNILGKDGKPIRLEPGEDPVEVLKRRLDRENIIEDISRRVADGERPSDAAVDRVKITGLGERIGQLMQEAGMPASMAVEIAIWEVGQHAWATRAEAGFFDFPGGRRPTETGDEESPKIEFAPLAPGDRTRELKTPAGGSFKVPVFPWARSKTAWEWTQAAFTWISSQVVKEPPPVTSPTPTGRRK